MEPEISLLYNKTVTDAHPELDEYSPQRPIIFFNFPYF
jgi:hypothetical protein